MNKDILNFNKEVALEIKQVIKKCQDYEKELILKSAKDKGLFLEILNEGKFNQTYLVKNIDYLIKLIKSGKIKFESALGKELDLISRTYSFEDLLIIENIKKENNYRVLLKEDIINLNNYDSEYETLNSFLNKYIEED